MQLLPKHFLTRSFPDSNILRGLATIEADVSSHVEAVLHDRLSRNPEKQTVTTTGLSSLEQAPLTEDEDLDKVSATEAAVAFNQQESSEFKKSRGWQIMDDFKRKLRKAIR